MNKRNYNTLLLATLFVSAAFAETDQYTQPIQPEAAQSIDLDSTLMLDKEHINAQDADGKTQLHRAAEAQDAGAIMRLLLWGANPTIRDNNGKKARDYNSLAAGLIDPVLQRWLLSEPSVLLGAAYIYSHSKKNI